LITPRQLHDIALFQRLLESVGLEESDIDDLARHRLIRRLIGIEVTDLIEATDHRIVESGAGSVGALQLLSHNVIGFSDQLEAMNRQLKDFLYQNMYQHHRVVRMHMKAEQILEDLFRAYTERPDILSQEVRERAQEGDLHRTVCDYVAGMTDRFAETEHAKLFQPGERP
jgi:dGTPase